MDHVFVWINNDNVLVNLSNVAYIRFWDEPDSKAPARQPGIVFRVSDQQKEEILPIDPGQAERLKNLLGSDFRLVRVRQP